MSRYTVQKAVDAISKEKLISKIGTMVIRGKCKHLISTYINDRPQKTIVNAPYINKYLNL